MKSLALQKTAAAGQVAVNVITDTSDDPVMIACEEYFRLNKIWVDANPEGETPPTVSLNNSEYYQLSQVRRRILVEISRLKPSGNKSLLAKRRVFQDILNFEGPEGPELVQFAVSLLENYHSLVFGESSCTTFESRSFSADDDVACKQVPDKKPWKFNIKFFGIFSS